MKTRQKRQKKQNIYFLITAFHILLSCQTSEIVMKATNNQATIFSNGQYNDSFINNSTLFNCSADQQIWTYSQNFSQLEQNTPYYIQIKNTQSNQTIEISNIQSVYNVLKISLNGSSCPPISQCQIQIRNNCPNPVSFFDYYDQIQLTISGISSNGFSQIVTYNVICDNTFTTNTFQWGINIIITFSTVLITISAIYSRAWSIKGEGIVFNYYLLAGMNIFVILGAVLGYFAVDALNVLLQVLTWIMTILCTGFCSNQMMFLLKCQKLKQLLQKVLFDINIFNQKIKFRIQVMDIFSLVIGLAWGFGWWFSGKNWIVSDIINIAITITIIKIIKFTELKVAVISFFVSVTVQMAIILIVYFTLEGNYNNILINKLNNVFYIQLPTINPVYNQKCAWLPLTAIAYPGVLLAYFRRFDTSRNTRVYLTIGVIMFVIGSVLWQVSALASPFDLPFGLITQPATIGLVAIFASQRKQMRTLWQGKFYDEEFADKEGLKQIQMQVLQKNRGSLESQNGQKSMRDSLFTGLKIDEAERKMYELQG